jgi:hypothetical protein
MDRQRRNFRRAACIAFDRLAVVLKLFKTVCNPHQLN